MKPFILTIDLSTISPALQIKLLSEMERIAHLEAVSIRDDLKDDWAYDKDSAAYAEMETWMKAADSVSRELGNIKQKLYRS